MSTQIVEYSLAKINLTLHVRGVVKDGLQVGYHQLEMLNSTVDFGDRLTMRVGAPGELVELRLNPGSVVAEQHFPLGSSNLIVKAVDAFYQAFPVQRHALTLEVLKLIPMGAGLGGGSSNAAATLRALAKLHLGEIAKSSAYDQRLLEVATGLGADVPFALKGGLARVQGIGELVSPVDVAELDNMEVALVLPQVHCSTPEVFREWDRLALHNLDGEGKDTEHSEPSTGRAPNSNLLLEDVLGILPHNDLLPAVMSRYPEVSEILARLRKIDRLRAGLSGSGAALFVLPVRGMKMIEASAKELIFKAAGHYRARVEITRLSTRSN